ncbi:hypothetical protein [Lacihabitans soyangensis]|uniref:Uncharacterized protein n=1 Tax=Lacihabitans soyangensis TaxID=869394 RepID=A0AAE3H259_9BACT|nr:hypothetical protein [Lacihabitans soyangensis]MCP9763543.1 hypothetical protein [Lacihabitans soyangensis]
MINDFLIWFLDYVQYFLILPLAVGILNYKYLKGETMAVFYYILIAIFFEILSRTLMHLKVRNTLPFLHLYTVVEFSIFWLFYYRFFKVFYSPLGMKVLLVTFLLFAILNAIFLQKINTFNTYARGFESLIMIALSLMAFNKIIVELDTRYPTSQPVFWVNSALLFYFSGNLVVFVMSNYISGDNKLLLVSWGIHAILMAILNSFIAIGLWQTRRQ